MSGAAAGTSANHLSITLSVLAFLISLCALYYSHKQAAAATTSANLQKQQHNEQEAARLRATVQARFTRSRDRDRLQLTLENVGLAPATNLQLWIEDIPAAASQFVWPDDKRLFPIGSLAPGATANIGLFVPDQLPGLLRVRVGWTDASAEGRLWSSDLTTS